MAWALPEASRFRPGSAEYNALKEVLKRFFDGGATLIDTAPTYGNAEDNLGPLLAEGGYRKKAFIATKLSGVSGREAGLEQFNNTLRRLKTDKVELLQVHNLRDWKTQLEVARELKKQGKVKYVGVTHYTDSAHDEIADIVQASSRTSCRSITRSRIAASRSACCRSRRSWAWQCSPTAISTTVRCSVRSQGKPLPGWAAEAGITSWAQMFLKYSLSFDAVTAVIPATGKPDRQADNLKAGEGALLTVAQRKELTALFA